MAPASSTPPVAPATTPTRLYVHTVDVPDHNHPFGGINAIRDVLQTDQVGVVYRIGNHSRARQTLSAVVHQTRLKAPSADILVDANRYSGKRRMTAGRDQLDDTWVNEQFRNGLNWATTNSGHVRDGDHAGLAALLRDGARQHATAAKIGKGVWTVVSVNSRWLTHDSAALTAAISAIGTPVLLVLEHKEDPLSAKGAVSGLVDVLQAGPPVGILRCDASVIGALTYGATLAAVGDSSSLRHNFPIVDGRPRKVRIAAFVPGLLAYVSLERLDDAITADPSLPVWYCTCHVCAGRPLSWLANYPEPGDAAFAHSVAAIAETCRQLGATPASATPARAVWHRTATQAQLAWTTVAGTSGQLWTPPSALNAWRRHYDQTTVTASARTPAGSSTASPHAPA